LLAALDQAEAEIAGLNRQVEEEVRRRPAAISKNRLTPGHVVRDRMTTRKRLNCAAIREVPQVRQRFVVPSSN
jgi:hypothetical protein